MLGVETMESRPLLPDPPSLLSPHDFLRALPGGGKRELTRLNPTETTDFRRPMGSVSERRSGLDNPRRILDGGSAFDALRKGRNPGLFSFFGNGVTGGLAV